MDSVSANFFVGVLRALPIDFVHEITPRFDNSRFGLESRRFAANYRWRCLHLWHADGELRYRVSEKPEDSNNEQPVDVEQFGELAELQFDSIQLLGGDREMGQRRYGPGWVKESDENAIISVIQKSAIAKCHVEIRDYGDFTSRHFLEPIFDRITALDCSAMGFVSNPDYYCTQKFESFLKDLAQNGKLKKVKLSICVFADPSVHLSLIRCCRESMIYDCRNSLEFAKNRIRELLALAEERRLEPWSALYYPLVTIDSHLLPDVFVSEGFEKRPGNKWTHTRTPIYTKTVGGIDVNFWSSGVVFQCIAIGCDITDVDPFTRIPLIFYAKTDEMSRRLDERKKQRQKKKFKGRKIRFHRFY